MNETHIQSAEKEIEAIKLRILDREKTMAFLKIQNDTDKKAVKTFEAGLVKLRTNANKPDQKTVGKEK